VLPVEIVGFILTHVDELTLPSCYAVSHTWATALLHYRVRPATTTEGARPSVLMAKEGYCLRLARLGRLAMLRWARRQNCPWNKWICAYAALGGHLEVVQWARANGCPWDETTCSSAARGGHLEVLQWARQ
jgi:hypothetical protein